MAECAFDELLGGFNPTSSNSSTANKSIGAMKKAEVAKTMDPEEEWISLYLCPDGSDPDPYLPFEKKPDPDSTLEK